MWCIQSPLLVNSQVSAVALLGEAAQEAARGGELRGNNLLGHHVDARVVAADMEEEGGAVGRVYVSIGPLPYHMGPFGRGRHGKINALGRKLHGLNVNGRRLLGWCGRGLHVGG